MVKSVRRLIWVSMQGFSSKKGNKPFARLGVDAGIEENHKKPVRMNS